MELKLQSILFPDKESSILCYNIGCVDSRRRGADLKTKAESLLAAWRQRGKEDAHDAG